MKFRPVGTELFRADRQTGTDKHTNTHTHTHTHTDDGCNSGFSQFFEHA